MKTNVLLASCVLSLGLLGLAAPAFADDAAIHARCSCVPPSTGAGCICTEDQISGNREKVTPGMSITVYLICDQPGAVVDTDLIDKNADTNLVGGDSIRCSKWQWAGTGSSANTRVAYTCTNTSGWSVHYVHVMSIPCL